MYPINLRNSLYACSISLGLTCLALLAVLKFSVRESRKSSSSGSKFMPVHSVGTKISMISSAINNSISLGEHWLDIFSGNNFLYSSILSSLGLLNMLKASCICIGSYKPSNSSAISVSLLQAGIMSSEGFSPSISIVELNELLSRST